MPDGIIKLRGKREKENAGNKGLKTKKQERS